MQAFQELCRTLDRDVNEKFADFSEEADKILTQDAEAREARIAHNEHTKATVENYQAPQFAAIDRAGNFFLQTKDYSPEQKSYLLGKLLARAAHAGALKPIAEATDEDFATLRYVADF